MCHSDSELSIGRGEMKWRRVVVFFLLVLIAPVALSVEAGDPAPAWRGENLTGQEVVFPDTADRQVTVLICCLKHCSSD